MKGYERIAVQITNLLRSHPRGLTITGISQALGLNRNSVAKYLEILVTSGHVEKQRVGRAKVFFLSQRVPISAMLNLSSDMILILDGQSGIWYVNDTLLAFEGRNRAEFIGTHVDEIELGFFSDPEISGWLQGAPGEQEFRKEVEVPRRSGTFFFSISLVPTIFEDGSRGTTVIIEDITLRRKAEVHQRELLAFLQELIDRVPTPVLYKDLEGRYLGCNRAFEEYTRKRREEILDRKAADILPERLASTFEALDAIALETGLTQSAESSIRYGDGTHRDFIVIKAPFRKPDGSPGGIVGTIFDITERMKKEEVLREKARALEARIQELERSSTG
jgi:PAS domain S-box-containing protein